MTLSSHRLNVRMCSGCLEKMREIDRLKRKLDKSNRRIAALEKKLGERRRSPDELPFGASTPSSKLPFKENSPDDKRQLKGGAKPGHVGHGRKIPETLEPPERLDAGCSCPDCGGLVKVRKIEERHVRDYIPERVVDRSFLVETSECQACGRLNEAKVPDTPPRGKYTFALLSHAAGEHYLQGRTQGDICERFGIGRGAFNHAMKRMAYDLEPCMHRLISQFLEEPVRFGDETGYREDGVGRYVWLLSTLRTSIFLVGQSRASSVPLELIEPHMASPDTVYPGVLVVDRYPAYNLLPFLLQYCYAHLKRDVEKLEKQFPNNIEVRKFCRALVRQLAAAMKLRKKRMSDSKYYRKAQKIASKIIDICDSQASHQGIQDIQNIFRQNPHRLYHWVRDRRVPADNNYSERGLRPLVISRKLSFGTQSANGSRARTVLMSVLHTLEKRGFDPVSRLQEAIALKAAAPDTDLADFLFPEISGDPPLRSPPVQTACDCATNAWANVHGPCPTAVAVTG